MFIKRIIQINFLYRIATKSHDKRQIYDLPENCWDWTEGQEEQWPYAKLSPGIEFFTF